MSDFLEVPFCLFRVRGNRYGTEGIPDPLVAQIRIQPRQGRPLIGGPALMKVAQLASPGPAVQPAERAADGYDKQNQQPACCFEKYFARFHLGVIILRRLFVDKEKILLEECLELC